MKLILSSNKKVVNKKSLKEKIKKYFYETGELCASGVIAMNGGYVVAIDANSLCSVRNKKR